METSPEPFDRSQSISALVLVGFAILVLAGLTIFVILAFIVPKEDDQVDEQANRGDAVLLATASPTATTAPSLTPITSTPAQNVTPNPTATLLPVQDRQFDLGIFVQNTATEEAIREYLVEVSDDLQLNWIRVEMRWDYIEAEEGLRNWENWDRFFRIAVEYDLRILVTITGSPQWVRAPDSDLSLIGPPEDNATFVNFVSSLVRRYPNQIHGLEVWDSMNFRRQWASLQGLNGADYVEMFRQVTIAVRAIDANIIMISGGLTPTGISDGVDVIDNFAYMDMMIEAGLLDIADCIGVHHPGYNLPPDVGWEDVELADDVQFRGPYDNPHPTWSFSSTMLTYNNKVSVAGYTTPLCLTEFGWAVAEDLAATPSEVIFALDNTLAEQSEYMTTALSLMDDWDFVWLAFIWNLNTGPENAFDASIDAVAFSLIRPDNLLAPVWQAIAAMNFRSRIHQ